MTRTIGRQTECAHRRCGLTAPHVVKHDADGRDAWNERVCANHAESDMETDPTAVEVGNA